MINLFDRVSLLTDRHAEGVRRGDVGVVVEIYADGAYEIEVSDADGTTIALFAAQPHEVERVV